MSDGPIKREREAWLPPAVSTPNSERVCYRVPGHSTAYCGRLGSRCVETTADATCADCAAAVRADSEAEATPDAAQRTTR